jgi:hypothetical protein
VASIGSDAKEARSCHPTNLEHPEDIETGATLMAWTTTATVVSMVAAWAAARGAIAMLCLNAVSNLGLGR